MERETVVGPRLSDEAFYSRIDATRPGLEEIPQAVAAEDWDRARALLAAEVRRTLQPERYLSIDRSWGGHSCMVEGETLAEAAERIVRGELISCSTPHRFTGEVDWTINPTYNQYREWTWQLSRHPEWAMLAERYRETGDERYAEAFVRFFRSWVRQAVVPENADGGATLCWRTIEAGIRMGGSWQRALHAFYRSPHFTDEVLVDWYKSIWEHGWRLRNFHRTGNWLIMEMNGLAQIGILYPQFVDAPAWKAYAFERLVHELDAQVYPDGFQVELSTGYHQVDVRNYQWLIDVCEAYDEPLPDAFRTSMERMHDVNLKMMMPDGRLPDVNDGGWIEVAPLMDRAVHAYPERTDLLWAYMKGSQGAPPTETSVAFPYAGYYVMRTDWSPDALWALVDGGPFGYGHQHEDKGNVLLHAYGRLLLAEGGNYAYDSSEMRRYVLSTRAHNTIRVDGQDQNRRLNY
ncbi:MAG: alginate lyase family protein, partial [Anaerolineae bacterium]|nr:alginate lyase family protein [Anaerolineae bacterium]